jgi:hypothetical protein
VTRYYIQNHRTVRPGSETAQPFKSTTLKAYPLFQH